MLRYITQLLPQSFIYNDGIPSLYYHRKRFWTLIDGIIREHTLVQLSMYRKSLIIPICQTAGIIEFKNDHMLDEALEIWKPPREECIELLHADIRCESIIRIIEYYPDLATEIILPIGAQYLNPQQEISLPNDYQMRLLMSNPKEFIHIYTSNPHKYAKLDIPIYRIFDAPIELLQVLNITPDFSLSAVLIAYRLTGKLPDIKQIKNAAVDYLYRKLRPDYSVTREYNYEHGLAEIVSRFGLDVDILVPILYKIRDINSLIDSLMDGTGNNIWEGYHTLYMIIMATVDDPQSYTEVCDCIGCEMLLKKLQLH